MLFRIVTIMLIVLLLNAPTNAIEKEFIVKLNSGHSDTDNRHIYNWEVLEQALKASTDKYGTYRIKITGSAIPNHQRLKALQEGKYLNVAMSLTNLEWEEKSIPIRIPIRRGIFSYRLILANKSSVKLFRDISSVEDLKKLKVGVRKSWTTRLILEHLHFDVVDAYSYEALFAMLDKERFDYIPRGINEIYKEIETSKALSQDLVIEPNLALYMPNPYYIFVTPQNMRLAERLEYGLLQMIKNGDLAKIFNKYYGDYVEAANISGRKVINIGNPIIPPNTPLKKKAFWYEFDLDKHEPSMKQN